ncbi:hypothetical protein PO909_008999 [Leuciscus waleckii]
MAACSRELLPKKGTGNSVIWNWFGFDAADKTQTKPCCKICFKAVATGSSSTTNLFQHLRNKHREEWEKCSRLRSENGTSSTPAKKQTTFPESFTNCVPYDKNGARWKAITEAITFYIATDMLPIYSVEKRGFNHMLKVLDARYVVPSRKYFADVALPHLYNTTRENGVKDPRIDRAIGVCKKAVSAFSYSWKKRRDMTEVQAELGLPQHLLISESPTRWGSRQKMIERFLEQEKAITRVLGAERRKKELTKTIKANIMRYLESKYCDLEKEELLDMATLLDPRFRTTYIDASKLEVVKKRAVSEISALCNSTTEEAGPSAVQENTPPKKKMTLGAFFKNSAPSTTPHPQSEKTKIETELATYFLIPDIEPDTDPLEWWKLHQPNFPRLSLLAKKYLSIPATSAPSERVFSVGGGIVTCNRACLKPEVVDRLIFLAKNV